MQKSFFFCASFAQRTQLTTLLLSARCLAVVTTLTSHVTTVNNALDPISTLSNPNIYTLLAETATPRSTSAAPKPFRELPREFRRPRR